MNVREIRLQNLRAVVAAEGSITGVAEKIGSNADHISNVLSGRRGLGPNLAKRIEKVYDLAPGAMDQLQPSAYDKALDLAGSDAKRFIAEYLLTRLKQSEDVLSDPRYHNLIEELRLDMERLKQAEPPAQPEPEPKITKKVPALLLRKKPKPKGET